MEWRRATRREGIIPSELIEDTTTAATSLRLRSWLVLLDGSGSELYWSILVVMMRCAGLLVVELLLDQLRLKSGIEVSRPLVLGWGEDWLGWLGG